MANPIVQQILQALQQADEDFYRKQQLGLSQRAQSVQEQEAQRRTAEAELNKQQALAGIFGRTAKGGTVNVAGQDVNIPGLEAASEIEAAAAGKIQGARTKAELETQFEFLDKAAQKKLAELDAQLKAAGVQPGTPEYSQHLKRALGFETVKVKIGGQEFDLSPKDAAQVAARLEAAKIAGQTRVTVAGMRTGAKGGLSPAQETALAGMKELEKNFTDIQTLFEAAKDKVGPLMGRSREILRSQGIKVDKNFNELAVSVARLRNKILKIRSGSAVTDNELRRIAMELPDTSNSEQDFRIKLEQGLADLQSAIQIFTETAGASSRQGQTVIIDSNRKFDDLWDNP